MIYKFYQNLCILALMATSINVSATQISLPTSLATTYYKFSQTDPFYNIDIYIKWNEQPVTTTGTYAGFQFYFQNGGSGYMGTQIDERGKKIIFSIWDVDNESITALPLPGCTRFGHEGSGASCIQSYDWVADREYMVRIWALDSISGGVNWGGWIKDTVTGRETAIGSITLKDSKGYRGYGYLTPLSTAFHEHYGNGSVNSCDLLPRSKITWRGPYANNEKYTASSATSQFYSKQCFNSNISTTGLPTVTMESGGNTIRTMDSSKSIWSLDATYPTSNSKADCVFDWASKSYPGLFAPGNTASFTFGPYYIRNFSSTNSYLAKFDDRLVYYGPLSNGSVLDLGAMSAWVATAQCQ